MQKTIEQLRVFMSKRCEKETVGRSLDEEENAGVARIGYNSAW